MKVYPNSRILKLQEQLKSLVSCQGCFYCDRIKLLIEIFQEENPQSVLAPFDVRVRSGEGGESEEGEEKDRAIYIEFRKTLGSGRVVPVCSFVLSYPYGQLNFIWSSSTFIHNEYRNQGFGQAMQMVKQIIQDDVRADMLASVNVNNAAELHILALTDWRLLYRSGNVYLYSRSWRLQCTPSQ